MGGARRVSLQATRDRGGRFLSQLGGFQVSRRGYKGEERGNWQGEVKARGMRHVQLYIVIRVYVYTECLKCLNDTSCTYT